MSGDIASTQSDVRHAEKNSVLLFSDKDEQLLDPASDRESALGVVINASGHVQELHRNFNILHLASVGVVTGSSWPAVGGSIVVAIYNGGAPGVIYEFILVAIFYSFVTASIAELSSAVPSAAGVYHWASVTPGPKYGRATGYFAGWWNFFAWIFGAASMSAIAGNIIVSMYALFHPGYNSHRWHVFIAYVIFAWGGCFLVALANRALPRVSTVGMVAIVGGVIITVVVCAVVPSQTGFGYATSSFVWKDWLNQTGWSSDGFVFLAGMLNGAYAVGAVDCCSHLSEEIPSPRVNVPKAMLIQWIVSFVTALAYIITIFYAIHSLDDVLTKSTSYAFPLAAIYRQATNSRAGTFCLLLVILIPICCTQIGTYITASRVLWTLARDDATPFSRQVAKVSERWENPFTAVLLCGCVVTCLGCIYVASTTAFNAFIGSFVLLSSASYVAAILPYVLTRRKWIQPGPFYMHGVKGYVVHCISAAYILVSLVIYSFPFSKPVTAQNMNYASLITGGLTVFVTVLWFWKKYKGYEGPKALLQEIRGQTTGGWQGSMMDVKEI